MYLFLAKLKIKAYAIFPFLTGNIQIIKLNLPSKNRIALPTFNTMASVLEKP